MSSTDPTDPLSLHSSKHDALPLVNSGSLEGFIKYIGILSASSETQFASAVLDQIHSQDEELKTLRKKIHDVEESKRTTVNDMFTANETERAKRREYAAQIESLSATINERESKIDEHAKNLGALQQEMAKLESTNSQERAKLSQSAKDISTLQSSLKEKDQMIDQLKTAGSKLKSAFSSEKKKKEELEVVNTAMNAELRAVQGYIQKLENFRVQSSDINENYVATTFRSLWTSATNELSPLLEQDVPEDILKDKSIWERLKKPDNISLPPTFPLVPLNSSAAKAIRFALVLAVLFREMDQHIFQPSYFLSKGNNIRESLDLLADSDGEKEAFCRRILLSIDERAERAALKTEIQAVTHKMTSYVDGLFPEVEQQLFDTRIKEIVQSAVDVWHPIQRSQQKFETYFGPIDPNDNEWDRFPSAGDNTRLMAQDTLGLFVLHVFPCISLVEDGEREPLTKVIQLRSSQELYMEAQHEGTRASSVITRRSSTRPRRQSTADVNGRPFLGGNSINS